MEELVYSDPHFQDLFPIIQKNIGELESTFKIEIALRGNKIMFKGEKENKRRFKNYLQQLLNVSESNGHINDNDLKISLNMASDGKLELIGNELTKETKIKINSKEIYPRTYNQIDYIKAINNNSLVFGIGPAGTGKTFLAISSAVFYLLNKKTQRIVLTRPVVEAGEKLGFLPGDIQQKVNPYFRPLYDALYYLIGIEKTMELIERGIIEIAPLAYMRGRTIDNSFIILDEGQNTLNSQMKMFLTRFGQYSKVVITADISQIDLPDPKKSGVFRAIKILKNVDSIKIIHLTEKDVIRHPLVQKIIELYDKKKDEI